MKSLDALTSLPVLLAFVSAANVVSERTEIAHADSLPMTETGSVYPFIAVGILFAFVASGLLLVARETRKEDQERRRREKRKREET